MDSLRNAAKNNIWELNEEKAVASDLHAHLPEKTKRTTIALSKQNLKNV